MKLSWEKRFYLISLSLVLGLGVTWTLFVGGKRTSASSPAGVIHVNSTADILNPPAGVVTLRSAIQQANANHGSNTIDLTVPGTYNITLSAEEEDGNAAGDFDVRSSGDLTIVNTSGGAVVVDGNGLGRVFDLNPNSSSNADPFTVTLEGFTIQGGLTSGDGGGIRAQVNACLVLNNMTVTGNSSGGNGGGISAKGTKLIIHSSTIANNTAGGNGGGIEVETTGSGSDGSSITNSTIAGNSALNNVGASGGGINIAASFTGDLKLVSDTITGNVASNGGGVFWAGSGHLSVQSTIIAQNNLARLFRATLSGAQEVPPTNSPGTGTASLLLSADQTTITVNNSFSGLLANATAAHLHNAPAGQSGPIATDANGAQTGFTGLPAATSGTIPEQNFTVNSAFVTQLLQGNIYTNIHTSAFPAGEIRGQFTLVAGSGPDINTNQMFSARLSGGQEVPPVNSPGTGTSSIMLNAAQSSITVNGSFSGLAGNATAFHLHIAPAGQAGPRANDANGNPIEFTGLPAAASGAIPQQSFAVNSTFVTPLLQGHIYTNIHTSAFPNGELRGQFTSAGSFTDRGYNLIGQTDGSAGFTAATDQTGTTASPLDPKFELDSAGNPLLKNNGGPTQTIRLLCDSPAIDKGISHFLDTDQRGLPRTFDDLGVTNAAGGDGTDIGAFEVQAPACNRPPVARCKNITVSANSSCQASITAANVNNGSSDPDGDQITLSLDQTGPFSLGPHQVTLTVTDSSGATSSCTSTVTVVDTTGPTVNFQGVPDQTATADANCNTVVPDVRELVRAQSSDNCTATSALVITQTPAAGSTVGVGSHPIIVKVADTASPANSVQGVVGFTVADKTAPTINCQAVAAQTAIADANCSAKVPDVRALVRAQSSDSCTARSALVITQTPAPGSTVGLGANPITVRVSDTSSPANFTECSVSFTVLDKTGPTISGVSVTPANIWPPNHELVEVTINYTTADNCSASSAVTNTLSVTSNDPVEGTGPGDLSPDWVIVDDHHVQLRAERSSSRRVRTYTIKITSTDPAGNSSFKTVTVRVRPNPPQPGPLPSPWVSQDVGEAKDLKLPGSASFADGVFTVNGNGWDIWGTDDSFHFVYQPLNGDGEIVARVLSVEDTFQWAKAGVMIRENLTPDSRNAFMAVTPGAGTTFQSRPNPGSGGVITLETLGGHHPAPYWVRIVRSGNTFTGYQSSDGVTWVLVGTYTINMSSNVYIGLAVTSTNKAELCTATFGNVAVTQQ